MADEQTAGTVDGGNVEVTPGTPTDGNADVDALRQEVIRLRQVQQQALAEKQNLERLKQENDALRSQASRAGAITPPMVPADPMALRMRQALEEKRFLAAQGDADAMLQLGLLEQQQRLNAENQQLRQMLSIPDTERADVERLVHEHGVAPSTARLILRGMRAEEAEKKISAEDMAVRKTEERQRVATTVAPVAASEAKNILSLDEYGAKLRKLQAENRLDEAAQLRRDRANGKIQLRIE